MYIACKKCNTNFIVSPEQIGLSGRRVRCCKCQHIWHAQATQIPEDSSVLTPQIELLKPIEGGVHLPALITPEVKKTFPDRFIILVIFLILSFALFFSQYINFDYVGKTEYEFKIEDIKANLNNEKNNIVLYYRIINLSDRMQSIPDMRINFYDSSHNKIKTIHQLSAETNLNPHESVKIKAEFLDVPLNIETIVIKTGNQLKLLFE